MEDWAYAGSWDPDSRRNPCNPTSFGGYEPTRTTYTTSMLRAVNVLVETSNQKWPSDFGTTNNILNAQSGTGHVARNVRLALMLTDLVQPYIHWTSATLEDNKLVVNWEVGGAFMVDETWVELMVGSNKFAIVTPKYSGKTRWATGEYSDRANWPFKTQFSACIQISENVDAGLQGRKPITVVAKAMVDSAWAMKGTRDVVTPNLPPQSHVVNARTNPDWDMKNGEFRIKGQLVWESSKITFRTKKRQLRSNNERLLASADETDNASAQDCMMMKAIDDTWNPVSIQSGKLDGSTDDNLMGSLWVPRFFTVFAFVLFVAIGCYMWRTRSSATHQVLSTVEQ